MPGVTSLSVLFLLLALCPLDVAGLPEDIKVMFIRVNTSSVSLLDPATQTVSLLFTTAQPVTAMDYDPVNRKVYWCGTDNRCYVQDDDGSNPTVLFHTEAPVKDLQVAKDSILYYLDTVANVWIKRNGQQPEIVASDAKAFSTLKSIQQFVYTDTQSRFHDTNGRFIEMNDTVTFMSWNPSDDMLYAVMDKASGPEIWTTNLRVYRLILKDFPQIGYISVYLDAIVFTALKEGDDCYKLYTIDTMGRNLTSFVSPAHNAFIRPVLFKANGLHGSPTTDQDCVQDLQTGSTLTPKFDFQTVFTWTPKFGCLQRNGGTSIKVTLTPGLEDFSLLVMDPPNECSRDLGQFRQDITIPESCVVHQKVEVAIQLTEIKDILGGRFFRHFLFSCSDLGPDGTAVELMTDTNPDKTQATASNTSYADGFFHVMIVTSANLNNGAELSSTKNLIWSQHDIYLVLRHRLALGSQHRTLIPTECTINSTSHPEKKTMWLSKPDMECKQEMGLIDAWTIQSQRTPMDDVAYTQLFPFDFQVGEEVTITCNARECPYVADAGQLQGKCMEAFKKYESCGGTFRGSSPNRRREVTSLSGNGSVPRDQAASRVMSASFTLV